MLVSPQWGDRISQRPAEGCLKHTGFTVREMLLVIGQGQNTQLWR